MRAKVSPTSQRKRRIGPLLIILGMMNGVPAGASSSLLQVPFFPDKTDQCGPAALAGVLSFWGKTTTSVELRQEMYTAKLHGTLPMDLVLTAQAHGLKADMVRGTLDLLRTELAAGRPVVVMLNTGFALAPADHYVIITGIDDERKGIYMHSAGKENQFYPEKKFLRQWEKTDNWTLVARLPDGTDASHEK